LVDRDALHQQSRERGVNPLVYWVARSVLQPFFHFWFRLERSGLEHIPKSGPVVLAANHRSFLDPFVIGTCLRRPIYYVAKKELFHRRISGWFLSRLGAFPVNRDRGDAEMMQTARAILDRGDCVLIFPEGTRVRPGPLAAPRRGVARLALEAGAPIVPVAVRGTEDVRRGFRIRPKKIRIIVGRALTFDGAEADPSPQLAEAVTDRVWAAVELQWEMLGGVAPLRKVAVVGAGSAGTSLAVLLARAGVEVQLACRGADQVEELKQERENARYLPGVELPVGVVPVRASALKTADCDQICIAVPSRSLPAALAVHAPKLSDSAGVVLLSKGLVPPLGEFPAAYTQRRAEGHSIAVIGGPAHAADALESGAAFVLASQDQVLLRRLSDALIAGGTAVEETDDVVGVELAGTAKNVAALAAAAAMRGGPNAAGAAAGRVWGEIVAWGIEQGARAETLAGLAGAGDLVATVLAEESRNRRAGEKLAAGVPAGEIERQVGQAVESLDTVPLLAARLTHDGANAPETKVLAALVAGRVEPQSWRERVTSPHARRRARAASSRR
jgi:1-acyl-sn-glycerol-3-phosphate acyltransferase